MKSIQLDGIPSRSITVSDEGYEEIVGVRLFPVDYPDSLSLLTTSFAIRNGYRDTVSKELADLTVGGCQSHHRTISGDFMSVEVREESGGLKLSLPRKLFSSDVVPGSRHTYDVSAELPWATVTATWSIVRPRKISIL